MRTAGITLALSSLWAFASANVQECNRSCLIETAENYLQALVAHDPSAVSLADDINFVENVTPMALGQGLWESAVAGPDSFAICLHGRLRQTINCRTH